MSCCNISFVSVSKGLHPLRASLPRNFDEDPADPEGDFKHAQKAHSRAQAEQSACNRATSLELSHNRIKTDLSTYV